MVGGGIAGVAAAREGRRRGHDVVLFEPSGLASGASADGAGMVRSCGVDDLERALALRTLRIVADDPAFRRVGGVLAADDPAQLSAWGRPAPLPVELQPLAAARWGLLAPDDGVLDVQRWCDAASSGIPVRGERVAASDVSKRGRVILALGAWTTSWAAEIGLDRRLQPRRRHLLHIERGPALRDDLAWCWDLGRGAYLRSGSAGAVASACDVLDAAHLPPRGEGAVEPAHVQTVVDAFPGLSTGDFGRSRWGLRSFTATGAPWAGPDPDRDGWWWFCGFGGFGASCAPGAAEVLWDRVEGRRVHDLDVSRLDVLGTQGSAARG